jgi:proteic killer suppression protein
LLDEDPVRHRGLKRFVVSDDPSGLPQSQIDKLRKMVTFLQLMSSEQELYAIPTWRAHQLVGSRRHVWSLFVSRNWRLTFRVDNQEIEIIDLDFEDYH